jgi:hypothetical protein
MALFETERGGIIPPPPTQVSCSPHIPTQLLQWQQFPGLRLILVVCGCLAILGILFSTLSAHPQIAICRFAPVSSGAIKGCRARRRSPVNGPDLSAIAASYSRYSSEMQDASSIVQQQRKCREHAEKNAHTILPELQFCDESISGTKRDRAGLNAMLADHDGRFGTLYFDSLSRLAREFVITLPMLKELVYVFKVRIVSVSEGVDSDNGDWEINAIFRSWMHQEFLKTLRAAVLRGQEEALFNDWSVGDWCFGYASEPIPGSEKGEAWSPSEAAHARRHQRGTRCVGAADLSLVCR